MSAAHLDYETLADLAEGILDDDRTASATAHLTDCSTCQEREAELAEVSRVLAEVPAPSVPPELVSRIDEALAAAAAETPTTAPARWRRMHVLVAAAAAAAVVVVGGGVTLMQPAEDAANAPASAERPKTAQGDARPEAGKPGVTAKSVTPPVTTSGTDYRKSELAGQLAAAAPRVDQRGAPSAAQGATGPLSQRLADCIAEIGDGRTPVLIDLAKYEGQPATIIAFPEGANELDVWVTGPGCTHGNSDEIERTTVPRGG